MNQYKDNTSTEASILADGDQQQRQYGEFMFAEEDESFMHKEEQQEKQKNMLLRKLNGGFRSQEFDLKSHIQSTKDKMTQGSSLSLVSSPLEMKKQGSFILRTQGLRENLKGSLNISISSSQKRSESNNNFGSLIHLDQCSDEKLEELLELSRNDFQKLYEEGEYLGEGCSAVVKTCTNKITGKLYAVKIMRNYDEERTLAGKNEFLLMKKLKHQHIIKAKEFYVTDQQTYMVMEYVDGQELFDRISQIEKYDENIARKLFKQLLETIQYLHDKGICHRDIKPSNILILKQEEKIKLVDFNVSRFCENNIFQMLTSTGTEAFKAPEMFRYSFYDQQVDLWSAGCVLYTMLSGYQPFFEENIAKLSQSIIDGVYDLEQDPWPQVSQNAKDLIKKLLCVDPQQRITCQQALEHPWIKNEENETQTLHAVISRINERKAILITTQQSHPIASDVYPKGNYLQIFEKLCTSGLEPFGLIRERSNSDKEKVEENKMNIKQRRNRKQSENDKDQMINQLFPRKPDQSKLQYQISTKKNSDVNLQTIFEKKNINNGILRAYNVQIEEVDSQNSQEYIDLKHKIGNDQIQEADDDQEQSPKESQE